MKGTKSRTPYEKPNTIPFHQFPISSSSSHQNQDLIRIRSLSPPIPTPIQPNPPPSPPPSGMEDNGGTKLNAIVRLKEIIQRWQYVTLGVKGSDDADDTTGINPAISMRLKGYNVYSDSDVEDGCQTPDLPNDVPKGYLAVYVGPELRRFIIPTSYLSDPLFKILLEKVEEEFGFHHSGGLTIPCEIKTFKYLLNCMEHHKQL